MKFTELYALTTLVNITIFGALSMINPLISVIVPCYNQAEFLPQTLQSVFDQTWQNWECIIVNDGSTDNTEVVALNWCKKDERFIYLHQVNGGVSKARNEGIKFVKGSFIQFLDGDDLISKDKLSRSLEIAVQNNDSVIVISNFEMFTDNIDHTSKPYCKLIQSDFNYDTFLEKWDVDFTIPIHCGFFSSELLEGFSFNINLKGREDWFMWLYAIKKTKRCIFINEPFALYRIHKNGATKNYVLMQENFIKANQYIYELLSEDGRQIIYNKILNLYSNENSKNIRLLEKGLNVQDYIEIDKGRETLGFIGSIFFRILRKTGHLILNREKNHTS